MNKIMKYTHLYALFLMYVFCTSCRQSLFKGEKNIISPENKGVISQGPQWITRNIIQDRTGNIWIAAFDGIFRYDGKHFTNVIGKVSSARFFSVLQDSKGNFWFGSVGSGVYYYDGKFLQNFTIKDGLAGNSVTCIYEDKSGNIWFGATRYDGKSFRNFTAKDGLSNNNVNSIIQDKTGSFWFATTGNTFLYDGKTFKVFTHEGESFSNVRSIIEDKKGNIWLGGADGLWRYDGSTFTNFTRKFVGHIIEDKKGNIWTSSESANSPAWVGSEKGNTQAWALSRYDEKSLSDKKPMVTEITNKGMIFGISEALDGSIWFGAFDGVHRYDGKIVTDFKSKTAQQ